jgi:hypothetical protein
MDGAAPACAAVGVEKEGAILAMGSFRFSLASGCAPAGLGDAANCSCVAPG